MNDLQHRELTHLSAIQLSGSDTLTFLQGQCTQDTKRLAINTPIAGGFCNAKGRLISTVQLVLLALEPTRVLLIGERSGLEALATHLKKYAPLFRKMTFEFNPDNHHFYGLRGRTYPTDLLPADTLTLIPWGDRRSLLYSSETLSTTGDADAPELISPSQWAYDDILERKLWLDNHQSAAWVPQNVSLDDLDGVSFKKGCYTGQEVVARLHYKGQSKKRLFCLSFSADQLPETREVYVDDLQIGDIIQIALHNGQGAALAVLKADKTAEALSIGTDRQVPVELLH